MKALIAILAVSLSACTAVTVYLPESPPSPRCMIVAPVQYSLFVPADSPDQGTPLEELRTRVVESCKAAVREAGASALLLTDQTRSVAADGKAFTLTCSGMAYACP